MQNASVVTDPSNLQIASNGGPADVQDLVISLGAKSTSADVVQSTFVYVLEKQTAIGQRQRPHRRKNSVNETNTEQAQGKKVRVWYGQF